MADGAFQFGMIKTKGCWVEYCGLLKCAIDGEVTKKIRAAMSIPRERWRG